MMNQPLLIVIWMKSRKRNLKFEKVWTVVDASLPWLVASPDAIVFDPTLKEDVWR